MIDDSQHEIAKKILVALYEDWAHSTGNSLNKLRAQEQWDEQDFDSVIRALKDRDLIVNGSSNGFNLTADGVRYVEENRFIDEEEFSRHRDLRTKALAFLAEVNKTHGSLAAALVSEIADGSGVDQSDLFVDLRLLNEWGYVEDASATSYRITRAGLQYYYGDAFEDVL